MAKHVAASGDTLQRLLARDGKRRRCHALTRRHSVPQVNLRIERWHRRLMWAVALLLLRSGITRLPRHDLMRRFGAFSDTIMRSNGCR
jgi:hypothetical protein